MENKSCQNCEWEELCNHSDTGICENWVAELTFKEE